MSLFRSVANLAARDSMTTTMDYEITIVDKRQTDVIRIVTSTMGSISMLAGLFAVYWFIRMKRQFRHELIMGLIISDLFRDANFIAFAATSFIRGNVSSADPYCSASGFMIQFGTEVTDITILFLVIHMAMHIFNSKVALKGEAGLEKYRRWVFCAMIGFPLLSASLAFINPSSDYQMQGPWCSLPIRPFWYRLALAWIPRYLISATITVLTIAMILRVRRYTKTIQDLGSSNLPATNSMMEKGVLAEVRQIDEPEEENESRILAEPKSPERTRKSSWRISLPLRHSGPSINTWLLPTNEQSDSDLEVSPTQTPKKETFEFLSPGAAATMHTSCFANPNSRRASLNEMMLANKLPSSNVSSTSEINIPLRHERFGSVSTRLSSIRSSIDERAIDEKDIGVKTADDTLQAGFSVTQYSLPTTPSGPGTVARFSTQNIADFAKRTFSLGSRTTVVGADDSPALILRKRHRYIQRQMRLLLLYPVLYLLVWLCPFILHCFQYSDRWQQLPLFPLIIMAYLSTTAFGLLNVLVFCSREKPWTLIPNSDGTVMGSFRWRYDRDAARLRTMQMLGR